MGNRLLRFKLFLSMLMRILKEIVKYFFARFQDYVRKYPYLFTLQLLGFIACLAACIAIPVLGAAGFSALGPVAGSAAAAWQAHLGVVAAGSLFAFLQSATMGGAALGLIVAGGILGGAVAILPGVFESLTDKMVKMGRDAGQKIRDMWNSKRLLKVS